MIDTTASVSRVTTEAHVKPFTQEMMVKYTIELRSFAGDDPALKDMSLVVYVEAADVEKFSTWLGVPDGSSKRIRIW